MLGAAPPETDLYMPLPGPEQSWHPQTLHTHYFGFQIPEAAISSFIYLRYLPAFPLSQGGVLIYQGLDHQRILDAAYVDYEMTMPWPAVEGRTITTANGLVIDVVEPGKIIDVRYESNDGRASFEMRQKAVSPLVTRGHVMPGEDLHSDGTLEPGGSEQFMHATGTLRLDGEDYAIDCLPVRDRSWSQVRVETRGAIITPPIGWTPMCFGPDYGFNQVGYEHEDTGPLWKKLDVFPEIDPGRRAHHFAWVWVDGELRDVPTVRRHVLERHPVLHSVIRQEIEATDESGQVHRFHGRALAMTELPQWPNMLAHDSLYRWETDYGRVAHGPYQEVWHDRYQRAVKPAAVAVS